MTPYIKIPTPTRPFHLALRNVISSLGGYRIVAQLLFLAPVTVSKWMESPDDSGQMIPVIHLMALLAVVGQQIGNHAAQLATEELMQDHFANLFHRRLIAQEKLFEFVELLTGENRKAVNE